MKRFQQKRVKKKINLRNVALVDGSLIEIQITINAHQQNDFFLNFPLMSTSS